MNNKRIWIVFFTLNCIFLWGNDVILQPKILDLGNDWYKVEAAAAIQNITPEDAKNIALSKAYKAAIEFCCGTEVSGRNEYIYAESNEEVLVDNISKVIKQTSNGIILKYDILDLSL